MNKNFILTLLGFYFLIPNIAHSEEKCDPYECDVHQQFRIKSIYGDPNNIPKPLNKGECIQGLQSIEKMEAFWKAKDEDMLKIRNSVDFHDELVETVNQSISDMMSFSCSKEDSEYVARALYPKSLKRYFGK